MNGTTVKLILMRMISTSTHSFHCLQDSRSFVSFPYCLIAVDGVYNLSLTLYYAVNQPDQYMA